MIQNWFGNGQSLAVIDVKKKDKDNSFLNSYKEKESDSSCKRYISSLQLQGIEKVN